MVVRFDRPKPTTSTNTTNKGDSGMQRRGNPRCIRLDPGHVISLDDEAQHLSGVHSSLSFDVRRGHISRAMSQYLLRRLTQSFELHDGVDVYREDQCRSEPLERGSNICIASPLSVSSPRWLFARE